MTVPYPVSMLVCLVDIFIRDLRNISCVFSLSLFALAFSRRDRRRLNEKKFTIRVNINWRVKLP